MLKNIALALAALLLVIGDNDDVAGLIASSLIVCIITIFTLAGLMIENNRRR